MIGKTTEIRTLDKVMGSGIIGPDPSERSERRLRQGHTSETEDEQKKDNMVRQHLPF